MLLVKTPLFIEESLDERFINRWTQAMPSLRRLYLFHAYDEDAGFEDLFWTGLRQLYERATLDSLSMDLNGGWNCIDIRPRDFEEGLPVLLEASWGTMRGEDTDLYDSDSSDSDVD